MNDNQIALDLTSTEGAVSIGGGAEVVKPPSVPEQVTGLHQEEGLDDEVNSSSSWFFIDRRRDFTTVQTLLSTPSLEHIRPMVKSLCKGKKEGSPADNTLARLAALSEDAPNCREFLEIVGCQVNLHYLSRLNQPFRLIPTLLVGPPGVGKTYILGQVATVLGLYHERISLSNATEAFVLSGCPRGYGTSTPGEVAEKVSNSDIVNPLIILDELDKASFARSDRATVEGPLLALLEPETAALFEDACMRIKLNVSHVSWLGTANSIDAIPEPVLSRFLVVPIGPVEGAERNQLVCRQVKILLMEMGLDELSVNLVPEVIQDLGCMSVRALRNVLRLAIARKMMKCPGSEIELSPSDILYGRSPTHGHRPIGFRWS